MASQSTEQVLRRSNRLVEAARHGRGTFRARATTGVVLLAVAGCGGGATATPTPTRVVCGTSISSPSSTSNSTGQQWKGTITSVSDRHYFDGGANYLCSDAWMGTLSFFVDGRNAVNGSGALNLQGAAVRQAPGGAGGTHGLPPEVQTYNFSVGGERTTTGFNLQFNMTSIVPPQPGSIDVAGIQSLLSTSACPHLPGPKLTIAFDRPNHATASPVLNIKLVQGCPKGPTELQIDLFSSTSTIVLNGP
jgi:hypothetical protein